MKPMTNRELVESFYEAVGEKEVNQGRGESEGDIDELRALFEEGIEWFHGRAPSVGDLEGLRAIFSEDIE